MAAYISLYDGDFADCCQHYQVINHGQTLLSIKIRSTEPNQGVKNIKCSAYGLREAPPSSDVMEIMVLFFVSI